MASLRDLLFSQFVSGAENTFLKVGTLGTTVQPLLVSNTNIKTVLGQTLLGSGNITITASDVPNLDASKITSGTIDAARLPSYVDDVLEYANLAALPATGETGKIYVALDTNKVYRWSGSAYIEISPAPDLSGYLPLSGGTLTGNITLNAGTANGIAYLNGSKVLTTGSALTFDGTNFRTVSNVRIEGTGTGVTGSGDGAEIYSNSGITYFQGFNRTSSTYIPIIISGGTYIAQTLGGFEQMRLTSTGLGIGTSSPGERLDVVGTARVLKNTGATNTGDQNAVVVGATTSGAYAASYGAGLQFQVTNNSGGYSGGRIVSRLGADNFTANLVFQARNYGFSDSMTLDSNGRLLVGHNSPVNDNNLPVQLSAPINQVRFFAVNKATDYGIIFGYDNSSNYGDIRVVPSAAMVLSTNNTERVRITSAGDVGIGASSPGQKLEVAGNILINTGGNPSMTVKTSGAGNNPWYRLQADTNFWDMIGVFSDANDTLRFRYNNSDYLTITNDGIVRIGNTTGGTGGLLRVGTGFSGTPDGVLATSIRLSGSLEFDFDGVSGTQRHGRIRGTSGNGQGGAYGGGLAFQYYAWDGTTYNWSDGMSMDAGGNLGIGTSTPSSILELKNAAPQIVLNGTTTSGYRGLSLQYAGAQYGFAGLNVQNGEFLIRSGESGQSGYYLSFQTNGSERMRVDSSGNLGVGISSPSQKLHVAGRTYFATTSTAYEGGFVSGAANTYVLLYAQNTSGTLYMGVNGTTAASGSIDVTGILDNASYFGSRTSHATQILSNNSARITINSTGNVGIGTTSPQYKLDVSDIARISTGIIIPPVQSNLYNTDGALSNYGTNNAVYLNGSGPNGWLRLNAAGSENDQNSINIFASANSRIEFRTGNSERMRITGSGDIGIGTTGPSAKLDVYVTRTSSTSATSIVLSDNVTGSQTNGVYKAIRSQSNNGNSVSEIRFIETDGTNNNTAIGFATASTAGALGEKMRVAPDGVVSIRNAPTSNSLQFGTTSGGFYSESARIGLNGSALTFMVGSTTNETLRMTNGVVGIGNTNPSANATRFALTQPTTPSGTLPTVYYNLGWDNQGGQDNIGIHLQYSGGQVPNGSLLTARLGAHSAFVLNNAAADNNVYGPGGRPPVYLYSGPPGNYSSYGQPPATNFSAAGTMPRMAIYSEMTGMYDGYQLTGLSIKLAGSYGGGSTRDVYCSAVQATTNFGSDRGYGTSYGYYANVSSNTTANYAFYAAAGDAAKPGGGSWASTSDARVKNVIGQYARGLQDVLQINVVDFTYNGKGGHTADGRVYTGVVAQELQPVFPEMVKTHRGKLEPTDEQDTDILMVDNSALVYALVNCVKELKAELDQVKLELQTLKG